MLIINIFAKNCFCYLIALLELAIVSRVCLHCIVGEVDEPIGGIDIKQLAGGADVALLIAVHP